MTYNNYQDYMNELVYPTLEKIKKRNKHLKLRKQIKSHINNSLKIAKDKSSKVLRSITLKFYKSILQLLKNTINNIFYFKEDFLCYILYYQKTSISFCVDYQKISKINKIYILPVKIDNPKTMVYIKKNTVYLTIHPSNVWVV